MRKARACLLPHGKTGFSSRGTLKSLAFLLLFLYLSLDALTDFFHNHPMGSQEGSPLGGGASIWSCAACNWIQTSRANLPVIQPAPVPMEASSPLPLFRPLFLPPAWGEIPRLRSPPMPSHVD